MQKLIALTILIAAVPGCGAQGPATYPVDGTVTLDGAPIPQGSIEFKPHSGTNHAAASPVVDGRYSLRLPPGVYRVEIMASRTDPNQRDALGMPLVEQYVPAKYNRDSQLTFEVAAGKPPKNWELTSDP